MILFISEMFRGKNISYKMVFDLKTKYCSLKMNNITVINLKALAKQRDIKGYYKLRKAIELIHKLETHPDVNITRSVNTNAILD